MTKLRKSVCGNLSAGLTVTTIALSGCGQKSAPVPKPAPPAQVSAADQKQFLATLQQLPSTDRPGYIQSHQDIVDAIMVSSDENAKRQIQSTVVMQH